MGFEDQRRPDGGGREGGERKGKVRAVKLGVLSLSCFLKLWVF